MIDPAERAAWLSELPLTPVERQRADAACDAYIKKIRRATDARDDEAADAARRDFEGIIADLAAGIDARFGAEG